MITNALSAEERKEKMKRDILNKLHKQALDFVDDRPEQTNQLSDLILVLYNFGILFGYFIFAIVFFFEIREFGWMQCTKNPQLLHRTSINMLGLLQCMQFLNVIFAIVGITKSSILNEFL